MYNSLKDLVKRDKEIYKLIDSSDRFKLLYNIVNRIEGNKRHTSIHAAGIVISYKPLYEILPIIKNNSDDLYLTEYTMEYLEDYIPLHEYLRTHSNSDIKDVYKKDSEFKLLADMFLNMTTEEKLIFEVS